jgi:hypothetical protein
LLSDPPTGLFLLDFLALAQSLLNIQRSERRNSHANIFYDKPEEAALWPLTQNTFSAL